MSVNLRKSVSYVLSKPVSQFMAKDVLMLDQYTRTGEAARMLQHYERDDIVVTGSNKEPVGIVQMKIF